MKVFYRLFKGKRPGPPPAPAKPEGAQAVVIVPGVIESLLLLNKGAPDERTYIAEGLQYAKKHIGGFLAGAVEALAFRSCGRLDTLGEGLSDAAMKALYMRPDGTSVNALSTVIETAAESTYQAICAAGKWGRVGYGARMAMALAPRAGGDNVFVFCYDWRRGVVNAAADLRRFLADVKALTGDRALSLCGCSYGCQVIAQYLYAGGRDAKRIVFNAPAWQGTGLFAGLFRALRADGERTFYFNLPAAAKVLTRFAKLEIDPEPYMKLIPQRIVNEVAFHVVRRALEGGLRYCPGLWSCCAVSDYDEQRGAALDPEKNAALLKETDAAHYGVMRHIPEILRQAREDGVEMWCVMNDGTPLMTGRDGDGDGVIEAVNGAGALYLPAGQPAHTGPGRRVSPSGRYDLTNALLPDRTWVIRGQVHGQSWWDDASRTLIADLLLTGKPETVDDDPARPQFTETRCPADGVSLSLGRGADFILHTANGAVRGCVRNESARLRVWVLGVETQGLPYRVSQTRGLLRPGEALPVTLTPTGDAGGPAFGTVSVRYIKRDPLPLPRTRTFALRTEG